jgi:two-component system response regulator MprA
LILEVVKAALEDEGLQVHTTSNPTEAIKLYEQHWQSIKLVVMDYLMPEMTGDVFLGRLQQINPDVRAVLLTGHYQVGENTKFEGSLCGYLLKPFDLRVLSLIVRNAIEAASASAPQSPA